MKVKINTEWIILTLEIIIGIALACFNDEIKSILIRLMEKWQLILFILTVGSIIFTLLKWYCRVKIETKFSAIESYNKQLIQSCEYDRKTTNMTLRIFRDMWLIPSMMQNEETKEQYAKLFLDSGFIKDDLEEYGMPDDIIKRFLRIHFEREAEKKK
ncbi:MAG TPA: hypothetical protein VN026_01925 [Bacteroidia bacterium]|jgi:hypothetical protein|nr:hypothetical protein [Bacteroidia bacterium]